MRTSEYYGIDVPELGDRADITVVSDAIVENEKNQSGKIENMGASISDTIIELTSEVRTKKLLKYYNGLSVQFISPVNADAGASYKIKIDDLAEQPYNNQVEIKVGDIVNAIYVSTGFVTASPPMHNDVARKSTQIIAGNGLTGGGDLSENRTVNVASADDSIIVGVDNIKVNTYNGVDSTSTTRPASANAVKTANDNANSRVSQSTQIIAGNGLIGGGALSGNVTLNVASGIAGLVVNADNISLSLKDTYEDTSTTHAPTANALKKLYDFVKGNIACPYNVGDIFLTTNATNPSTVWLGTTWQKIEGRMLLGTSGSGASKATGGSNTVTLSTANLPSHTHSASQSAHTHSRGTQDIKGVLQYSRTGNGIFNIATGAFVPSDSHNYPIGTSGAPGGQQAYRKFDFVASRDWSGSSSSAQPSVSIGATGNGSAFSILSSYYTVHMWLRTA